jgi:DNA polymerase I
MSHQKKLFLLDAFALIYRAYFAFGNNQRYNSKGLNTSAILGFTNTLLEVLQKEKPTHIAVVFDAPEENLRVQDFSAYKANRQEMPEDIRKAIPYIIKIVEAFNIPVMMKAGYEADDVIGTLAKKAEKAGYITYMMTPDKDFGQLVSENIFIYKPAKNGNPPEIMGVKEVCQKFSCRSPLEVIDILGLWGDAVDNIPGIPGIGEKTAIKLVEEYGSVENLIAHADDLKGKMKENVINFAEQGILSKRLATIILDVPVEFNPDKLIKEEPNSEMIKSLFSELEFRNLAKRVLGEEINVTSIPQTGQMDLFGNTENTSNSPQNEPEETQQILSKTIKETPHNYQLISGLDEIKALANLIQTKKEFCFDTETTGLEVFDDELVGIALSFEKGTGYYIAIPNDFEKAKEIVAILKPLFENKQILKIAHNIKFDLSILRKYQIHTAKPAFDTMIAHYLIQPDMRHNMDFLSETYLAYKPISIETIIGKKGKGQLNMKNIQPEQIVDYAAEDADVTFQLKAQFEKLLETNKVSSVFYDIEMPLVEVLIEMEAEGINIDVQALKSFSKELEIELESIHKDIIQLAGTDFNPDSPKQLGQILYEVLGVVEKPKKTKTGQYATGEEVLVTLTNKHPIINKILDYRSLKKLKSTYVDTLPEMVSPKTGRIHTTYMQTVAATGRLSSNNPNLQNIPIRTENGKQIRKAFIPKDKNHLLVAADYSQIELRIMAALSDDDNMKSAFLSGEDIHTATAAKIYHVSIDKVDRDMRSKAKAVNFGIIYGQSAFGLSQNLNISRTEAKEIIDSYFLLYPNVKKYMDNAVIKAKELGYVETLLGRRRVLKDINSANAIVRGHAERNAINAPIQGTAADIIKVAMIRIHEQLKKEKLQSKMILQVHDELVFDVPKDELKILSELVKNEMENAVNISVPLIAEVNSGLNWLEAH